MGDYKFTFGMDEETKRLQREYIETMRKVSSGGANVNYKSNNVANDGVRQYANAVAYASNQGVKFAASGNTMVEILGRVNELTSEQALRTKSMTNAFISFTNAVGISGKEVNAVAGIINKLTADDFEHGKTGLRNAIKKIAPEQGKLNELTEQQYRNVVNTALAYSNMIRLMSQGEPLSNLVKNGGKFKQQLSQVNEEFKNMVGLSDKVYRTQYFRNFNALVKDATLPEYKPPPPKDYGYNIAGLEATTYSLEQLGRVEERVNAITQGFINYNRLGAESQKELLGNTSASSERLRAFSQAMTDANDKTHAMQIYHRELTASMGVFGTAFREVTQQVYWAALGFLFLTMTASRLEQAQLTAKQRAQSLADQYYAVAQALKAVNDANLQYGDSSNEAGQATVRYKQAVENLKLQKESLLLAYKNEALQNMQMAATQIPMMVNSIYMAFTAYGALRGVMAATLGTEALGNTVKQRGAIINIQNAATTELMTVSKVKEAIANGQVVMSNSILQGSLMALKLTYDMLKQSLHNVIFLQGVATFGITTAIGIVASYGATTFLLAQAEEEANRKMQETLKTTQALSAEYAGLTGLSDELNKSLGDSQPLSRPIGTLKARYAEPDWSTLKPSGNTNAPINISVTYPNAVINKDVDVIQMTDTVVDRVVVKLNEAGVK
jgi:hypothetical protein